MRVFSGFLTTPALRATPPQRGTLFCDGVVMVITALPLSLRRSTINVENVGVRLWQSSAICLRAFARSAFFYLLDRHASLAMTMGSKCVFFRAF